MLRTWGERSRRALEHAATEGSLAINPIVYAEVSIGYDRIEELDEALPPETFERLPLPWAAGFLAGECFVRYRRAGGVRRSPLPDFYVGRTRRSAGMTLLTRDPRRYRTYLPRLAVITP